MILYKAYFDGTVAEDSELFEPDTDFCEVYYVFAYGERDMRNWAARTVADMARLGQIVSVMGWDIYNREIPEKRRAYIRYTD